MWALRAARVFDGVRLLPDGALIVIDGSSILGVERFGSEAPANCAVEEVAGTVLPGLIDTHVHLCGDSEEGALDRLETCDDAELPPIIERGLQRHLASGVTTVRDLGDRRYAVLVWRSVARSGTWPTVLAAGPPITSVRGHCWNMGGEVTGQQELRTAVAERAERGVDVVKIMASGGIMTPGTNVAACQFSDAEIDLLVAEAHRKGLSVTAHAHALDAISQVTAAGVDGIEHCSGLNDRGLHVPDETVNELRSRSIVVCPTLGQAKLPTMPPGLAAVLEARGLSQETMLRTVRNRAASMLEAGVRIVSGSDGGIGDAKPHGILPISIADLVRGGAAEQQALASATSVAAEAIGVGRSKGRLAPGYDADFVIVDGNPDIDIADLQHVQQVYVAGRLAYPSELGGRKQVNV
jgi:imidazolonepropionase-like amidohydrolase